MAGKATVPIYHGDDFERMAERRREIEIAERKLEDAKRKAAEGGSALRLGDDDTSVADAEAAVEAARVAFSEFVDEAAERADTWVLRPIGFEEFRELLKAHPPRKVTETDEDGKKHEVTHPDDAAWAMVIQSEVNTETYPKALLSFVDPEDDEIRTVEEPFETVATLRKRIKRLTEGEFNTMWIRAHLLNTGAAADPKLSDSYVGSPRSAAT